MSGEVARWEFPVLFKSGGHRMSAKNLIALTKSQSVRGASH